jgi:hypothetical protein
MAGMFDALVALIGAPKSGASQTFRATKQPHQAVSAARQRFNEMQQDQGSLGDAARNSYLIESNLPSDIINTVGKVFGHDYLHKKGAGTGSALPLPFGRSLVFAGEAPDHIQREVINHELRHVAARRRGGEQDPVDMVPFEDSSLGGVRSPKKLPIAEEYHAPSWDHAQWLQSQPSGLAQALLERELAVRKP